MQWLNKYRVWVIAGALSIALAFTLWYIFFSGRFKFYKHVGDFTVKDGTDAIKAIYKKYGAERAALIERMMRLETAHFTSGQYKKTGTAGMEAGAWGHYVAPFLPTYTTYAAQDAQDKSRGVRQFIVWPSVELFCEFLNWYINFFKGDFSRWNSLDPATKARYAASVNSVTPFTTNALKTA
jgi:hypothetical protein